MTHIPVLITYTNEAGESIEDNFANLTMASRNIGITVFKLTKKLEGNKQTGLPKDFSIEKIDYVAKKTPHHKMDEEYWEKKTKKAIEDAKKRKLYHCDVCKCDVTWMARYEHARTKSHIVLLQGGIQMNTVHCDVCNADVKKFSIEKHNVTKLHLMEFKKHTGECPTNI